MRSPQISAGIIPYFRKGNQYNFLCVKHQKGHRGFPKGGIEPKESEIETAIREFKEETGITHVKLHPAAKFIEKFPIIYNGKQVEKTVNFFLGEISEHQLKDIDLQIREMADYKTGTFEEIKNTLTYPAAKQTFINAFNYLES